VSGNEKLVRPDNRWLVRVVDIRENHKVLGCFKVDSLVSGRSLGEKSFSCRGLIVDGEVERMPGDAI
jgi:hypothetical protein